MRIVSNIRGLCCWVCLDDVWNCLHPRQLLRESFHFPVGLVSRCPPETSEIQTSCLDKIQFESELQVREYTNVFVILQIHSG